MASQTGGELRGRFSSSTWVAIFVVSALVFLIVIIRSADVRTLLLICAALFVIERTLGDWLADRFGATFGKIAFLATVGALSWVLFGTERGRSAVGELMSLAGREARQAPVSVVSLPASSRPALAGGSAVPSSSGVPASTTPRPVRTVGSGEAAGGDPTAAAATSAALPNAGMLSTSTTLRASVSREARSVELEAIVSVQGARVNGGSVEFSVDGRAHTTVPVNSEGAARTTVTTLPSGVVRVTARYTGSGRFQASVGATYVSR